LLSSHLISTFNRIRILDATVFQLPDAFASEYQGSGGSSNTAGVKIQLEYDLLSGQFLNMQLRPGKNNDKTYGTICLETVEAGDLCLRDLGYFDLGDLQAIHNKEASNISRLKLNTHIYIKNPEPEYFNNGTLQKQTEYIQLDMAHMMSELAPGETMEIPEAYIAQNQKLPARVMIHRLTDDQTQTRLKNQAIREKKKGIVMKDKSKRLMGMNVYITNTSPEEVPTNYVYYMIKDYFPLLFQAMAVGTDELLKILHRLYQLLKKNGRKCHRYKKMTVFDILGVVYERTVKHRQAAWQKNRILIGFLNMPTFSSLASFETRIIS